MFPTADSGEVSALSRQVSLGLVHEYESVEQEIHRYTGALCTVMYIMHKYSEVKREPSVKMDLSVYRLICIPTFIYIYKHQP